MPEKPSPAGSRDTNPAAEALLQERFRRSGREHPVLDRLYREALEASEEAGAESQAPGQHGLSQPRRPAEDPGQHLRLGPLQLLVNDIKLPAVPQVLLELLEIIEDESSSAQDLAEVIRLDASLASYILRVVNSAYYSFPFPIDTVDRAVTLLGRREISSLALSSSFVKMFKDQRPAFVPLEAFWKHSIACGAAARNLARRCSLSNPERHFVSGLLHDLGRLVMFVHLHELSEEVLAISSWRDLPLREAESSVLGFDPGRFGASRLANRNFPKTLVAAVQHHHAPSECLDYEEPASVHIGDVICCALGFGRSGDGSVPLLDPPAWDRLGLETEALPEVAVEVRQELRTLLSPLEG